MLPLFILIVLLEIVLLTDAAGDAVTQVEESAMTEKKGGRVAVPPELHPSALPTMQPAEATANQSQSFQSRSQPLLSVVFEDMHFRRDDLKPFAYSSFTADPTPRHIPSPDAESNDGVGVGRNSITVDPQLLDFPPDAIGRESGS